MEQQYLIDTNVVIDYLGRNIPANGMAYVSNIMDALPNISVVTKIEVLGFNAPDEYYTMLVNFMKDSTIFDLTNDIVNATIDIRKKHKTKLPDAIIAATAIVHNMVLVSRNMADFKNITALQTINPWEK